MLKIIPNIPVANVERSVDFYCGELGFELTGLRGRGGITRAHLRRGTVEIIFRSFNPDAPLPPYDPSGANLPASNVDPSMANQLILHVQTEDILGVYEHVKKRVHVVRALEPTLFGSAEFMIRDINGHLIAFTQAASALPKEHSLDMS